MWRSWGLGPRAGQDGEAVVFEPAIDVGEAGFAKPVELVFDGGAAVVLLAVEGVGDLVGGGAGFADLLEPEFFVEIVDGGGGAGDLLSVDEDAAGAESGEDLGEEGTLGGVVDVVNGEGGDDGVVCAGDGGGGVVGDLEGDVGVGGEASAGLGDHGLGEVGEDDVGVGIPLTNEGGEEAGAGAEVEDGGGSGGDEIGGAAVEGVEAGNEFGAVGVVGGGGDVEDFAGGSGHWKFLSSCLGIDAGGGSGVVRTAWRSEWKIAKGRQSAGSLSADIDRAGQRRPAASGGCRRRGADAGAW